MTGLYMKLAAAAFLAVAAPNVVYSQATNAPPAPNVIVINPTGRNVSTNSGYQGVIRQVREGVEGTLSDLELKALVANSQANFPPDITDLFTKFKISGDAAQVFSYTNSTGTHQGLMLRDARGNPVAISGNYTNGGYDSITKSGVSGKVSAPVVYSFTNDATGLVTRMTNEVAVPFVLNGARVTINERQPAVSTNQPPPDPQPGAKVLFRLPGRP